MQDLQIHGYVRRPLEGLDAVAMGADEQPIAITAQMEQLVAAGASPYEEICRVGRMFSVRTTAAIAAVIAIPTTAHMLALFNNEPDGGRSYVIDSIFAQNVVSTAAAGQAQLLVCHGQVRETAPTDSGLKIVKLNGLGGGASGVVDSRARTILNATALPASTGLAENWRPFGPSTQKPGAAATPGYGLWAEPNGKIIVPPGRYLGLHVLANVVGETFVIGVDWHERQLALG